MKVTASAIALACGLAGSGSAFAAARCNIVGTWTDHYGINATFTTEKAGTASAPTSLCKKTYHFKVTELTKTTWDSTGTAKGCPTITAALYFAIRSCASASGDVTFGINTLPDIWTKTGAVSVRPGASELLAGFRH